MRIPGLMTALVMMLAAVTAAHSTAHADIVVRVDKAAQRMHVLVDGELRHKFAVSTGLAGGPPLGTFKPQRLERNWHSRLFNMAPMPYSIFFHGHFAIHGTNAIRKLGQRASHGCVRLHPDNAATLFNLVKTRGMANTRIIIEPSTRAADLQPQQKADVKTDSANSATAEAHVTGVKAE
jgi:lipoprotein-anchoring transpeptidase ErfK/SrfK